VDTDLQNAARRTPSDADQGVHPRAAKLAEIARFVDANPGATLLFVCTHNSRRSQIAEVCAWIAAARAGAGVRTASAGTEVTAFHPNAVAALERTGLRVRRGAGANPEYTLSAPDIAEPKTCLSKRFDDPSITGAPLAAIMVCDSADAACPAVPGADARFSLTYRDPKEADGSPDEAKVYDERVREITREMDIIFGLTDGDAS